MPSVKREAGKNGKSSNGWVEEEEEEEEKAWEKKKEPVQEEEIAFETKQTRIK